MAFGGVFRLLSKIVFLLLLASVREIVACSDSYQCRFGQQCCKKTKSCQASCSEEHETNVGVIIGIVVAVALGNALFWITFCCLCWCKSSRKSRFQYRLFGNNEGNRESTVIDDDMIDNIDRKVNDKDEGLNNKEHVIDNIDEIIDDHIVDDDEKAKVLRIKDCQIEEIGLSIIKINRPILKSKKDRLKLGESSTGSASHI